MDWTTKNVYSNFEEKNVLEDESVLEPNYDTVDDPKSLQINSYPLNLVSKYRPKRVLPTYK